MRIEIRPSSGTLAAYANTQYMAFNPEEPNPTEGVYGFGASYEEALQDYLKKAEGKPAEYCEHSGVKLGFAVTPEKLVDMMREECQHESDGKKYDTIPTWPPTGCLEPRVQNKCTKCGEFYR